MIAIRLPPESERLDDLDDLHLAEQRLIALRAGKTQAVPLEDVMKGSVAVMGL